MGRLRTVLSALFRHLLIWVVGLLLLAPVIHLIVGAAGTDPAELFRPVTRLFEIRNGEGASIVEAQLISSLTVSGAIAAICLLVAPTAGYALARARFPGRRVILTLFALVLIAPITLLVVPLEIVLLTIGLHDTYTGLAFAQLGLALSLSTWIVKRAFDRLDPMFEESARLDGANQGRIFWAVALPQVRLAITCAVAVAFASSWGEYLFATTFLTKAEHFTISAAIVSASRPTLPPWDRFAPIAIIAAAPTVLLLLLVQRRLGDLIQLDWLAPRPPADESA